MPPRHRDLIDSAPWREAVTYRETWPHEYVRSQKDGQGELLSATCERFRSELERDEVIMQEREERTTRNVG